ncbi:hypothetical protein AMECASPLE_023503 [Ameca splendens]|uniref:Uncharacterized protein n=1 Tax=Ameca splendens TaxID=208324 RepID=A0ABV0XH47_9TELE
MFLNSNWPELQVTSVCLFSSLNSKSKWPKTPKFKAAIIPKHLCPVSQGSVSQRRIASDLHQPGYDKASVCVVFVSSESGPVLHNLCSGGHVMEGETVGESEK